MHGDKHLGRIQHLSQPRARHLEYRHLRSGAETVLYAPEQTVGTGIVALELQDHIHYMLQHFRTGDTPLFRDMADQNDRDTRLLSQTEQHRRAFLDLRHRPRRGLHRLRVHRLYRIHYHELRLCLFRLRQYVLHQRLAVYQAILPVSAQPRGPEFYLPGALLPCHIQGPQPPAMQGNLQGQCRFPYAGFTGNEHEGPLHDTSAQEPVHLGTLQGGPAFFRGVYFPERQRAR